MPSFSNPKVDQGVQIVLEVDSLQPPPSPAESRVDFQREVGTGAIFEGIEMSASPAIKPEPRESRRPASLPARDTVALALGMGDPQRADPPTSGALVRHDDRLVLKDVDRLAELTQSFGKDFQSMNKAAFIAIAKEVARLERVPDDRGAISSLMDTVTTSNLSSEEKETILFTAVTSGMRRMQFSPLSREERAVVFAGLSELGNLCSEESPRMLLQVAKHLSAEISGKKQDDATASLNNLLF